MVAPLDHFLSGSKSSIYYKRIFHKRAGGQRLMLRIGTEGMGSILSRFSTRESGVDVYNLKLGFEWDFNFNGFHFYFGPEIGQSRYETDEGSLRVREENALFNTSAVAVQRDIEVNESEVRITSGQLFLGFKFDVSPIVALGLEVAGGYGQIETETLLVGSQESTLSSSERWDISLARFFFAEIYF
ncbi:MAG: hypothetical protein GVX96_02850 [Bacteroidetes bacterium]|jgi:hypothetical protein|nr:hypothetical protein [Bacteroidota bacterium]